MSAVIDQGRIIVEHDGPGFVMMYPDGKVEVKLSRELVEAAAKRWFKKNIEDEAAIGVGFIEWRSNSCPA